jgi:hypothetical protein
MTANNNNKTSRRAACHAVCGHECSSTSSTSQPCRYRYRYTAVAVVAVVNDTMMLEMCKIRSVTHKYKYKYEYKYEYKYRRGTYVRPPVSVNPRSDWKISSTHSLGRKSYQASTASTTTSRLSSALQALQLFWMDGLCRISTQTLGTRQGTTYQAM